MSNYNISDQDGAILVKTARKIVTEFVKNGRRLELDEDSRRRLDFESGIFVTLNIEDDLRGCIGFTLPRKVSQALPEAAIAAATQDPRFLPVSESELDRITFEVTVLTPPQPLRVDNPVQIPSKIKIGRDGLLIKRGYHSGLLLPQVPKEHGWDERKFLDYTCQKAGLPPGCWMEKDAQIFTFEGIIFKEDHPNGNVVRVLL
ncbi:MAG: TIGR00296 family protein [Candidatus Nitrosotenuis sp.]